jgi:hypothetical protein
MQEEKIRVCCADQKKAVSVRALRDLDAWLQNIQIKNAA